MQKREKADRFAHHTMAAVGGFFGVYALMTRSATFGSLETTNLIYLVVAGLDGSAEAFLLRLGATLCYIAGIIFATLVPKWGKAGNFRYWALVIDGLACLLLAWIPGEVDPLLALFPMFFATAVQWLAYTKADGFNSATIFSTNNLRQCFAGLTEYLYEKEEEDLRRFYFYGGTLLCFHLGVVYGWICMRQWGIQSIFGCIPLLILGAYFTREADKLQKKIKKIEKSACILLGDSV